MDLLQPGPEPEPARPPSADRFAELLDRALREREVSSAELSRRLRDRGESISAATLRSWRTGRRRPEHQASRDAIAAIEQLLDLDRGALQQELGPSRRPGPAPARVPWVDQTDRPATYRRLLAEIGVDLRTALILTSTQHVLSLGPDRRMTTKTVYAGVRAYHPVSRLAITVEITEAGGPPEVGPLLGGRVTGRSAAPDDGIFLWAFELDRPLAPGETTLIGYQEDWPPDAPLPQDYGVALEHRIGEVGVAIRFGGRELPVEAAGFTSFEDGETPLPVTGPSLAYVRHDVGPGSVSLRWRWSDSAREPDAG